MTAYRMSVAEYRERVKSGNWPWLRAAKASRPAGVPAVPGPQGAQGPQDEKTEETHQRDVFAWARRMEQAIPELQMLYHVPNGGYRRRVEAARLVGMGVKAGYPDIALDVARGGFHGLRIEMKRRPNRPTEQQRAWLRALAAEGYKVAVCYSADEAVATILDYLQLRDGGQGGER